MALVKVQMKIVCLYFIMLLLYPFTYSNFKSYLKQVFISGKGSVDRVKIDSWIKEHDDS